VSGARASSGGRPASPPPPPTQPHPPPPPPTPTRACAHAHIALPPPTLRLSALDDSIKVALKKMGESDKEQQRRISELEARVGAKVTKEVEEKLGSGAGAAAAELGSRLASIEKKVSSEVLPQVAAIASKGSGWVKPFVGLAVVVLGLGVWFLCFRSWSKKNHKDFGLPYKNH
jgi:hypothetical protein